MWFLLSLLALSMLVSRRTAEKHVTARIDSLGLSWLQQAIAIPFIVVTLFFAKFYWPTELNAQYWGILLIYVVLMSIDIYCYFKALSLADVSYVAPLLSLVAIGNIFGAFFILHQVPSTTGIIGAMFIVFGAVLTYRGKHKTSENHKNNRTALLLILLLVAVRSIEASLDVLLLRDSNPTSFNFYSSILAIPLLLGVSLLIMKREKSTKYKNYWSDFRKSVFKHKILLLFIGLTYTVNMLATYQAKLIGPNAGYVGAIKNAGVLPMMLIGLFLFKEKIVRIQWYGLAAILVGLVLLATN